MRYYYKDTKNNYLSYKSEHNEEGLTPVSEKEFNSHISRITKVVDEGIRLKQTRIAILKQQLQDTDYQAIKYAEGQLTADEYAPIKAQRQAWREQINALEGELANG